MKTSSSGGLQDPREIIFSRRHQNYFHKDILIRRIEESPRGYLLKAKSKNNFHEDLLVRSIEESPRGFLLKAKSKNNSMKTSSLGGLKNRKRVISPRHIKKQLS